MVPSLDMPEGYGRSGDSSVGGQKLIKEWSGTGAVVGIKSRERPNPELPPSTYGLGRESPSRGQVMEVPFQLIHEWAQ